MPFNRYTISGGVIALLVLANIISYYFSEWGLITVKVKDAPLRQVVKSIEWQGWVTIYSNLPPDTKVTMWCDHVPLAEAMDTLASGIVLDDNHGGGSSGDQNGTAPASAGPSNVASASPPAAPGGNGPGDGGNRDGGHRDHGGFGHGGFGRNGASWGLAFFVAPSSGEAKAEIHAFQEGTTDDSAKIFHYSTPIQMLASDDDFPSADPRLQPWPGMKPSPPPAPAPDPNAAPADNTAAPDPTAAPAAPPVDPNSVQAYLDAIARGSDIWIMAPADWNPNVSSPPAANSSIIGAVKNLVSSAHGSVIQGIVLRNGFGSSRSSGRHDTAGGDDADWSDMNDRLRTAINGLPEEDRPQALNQLNEENKFRQAVMAAPEEQRRQMYLQHMMTRAGGSMKHMSPEKRAARYQQAVANRTAAKG